MNVKLLITIPSLALLAACSGGSLGEVSFDKLTTSAQNAFLLSAEPGSVSLNGKMEINVSSIDATIGVNFDNSEVGSTVSITEGDYAGFVLTKVENVGGKPTMLVSAPDSYESTSAILGDLNTYHQSTVRFVEDVPLINEKTLNGFTLRNETYGDGIDDGTPSLIATSVGTLNGPSLVEAVITFSTIGNEETYALSANRSDESAQALQYNSPESGGVYSYEGVAIVNGDGGSYTSENAKMGINFTNSTGTFEADNFIIDEPPSSKIIKVTSILSIDNQYGIISSISGKITVDESESPLAINGIIDFNNDAVAGAMIPMEETNGIVGGIFVVASTPTP